MLTNSEKFRLALHLEMKTTLIDPYQETSGDITTDVATHTHTSVFIGSVAQKPLYTVFCYTSKCPKIFAAADVCADARAKRLVSFTF